MPAKEILFQNLGLQLLATQLNSLSNTAKRIEALQTALEMEREQLAK
jgi:hypothetical protein